MKSIKNVTAETKRVAVSFTFEEIHFIDNALGAYYNDHLARQGKDASSEEVRVKLREMFEKVRTNKILPTCDKWYYARNPSAKKAVRS